MTNYKKFSNYKILNKSLTNTCGELLFEAGCVVYCVDESVNSFIVRGIPLTQTEPHFVYKDMVRNLYPYEIDKLLENGFINPSGTTLNYKQGDIFTSNAHTLVNPVNCVGVMEAGLAKQFKKRYPEMFKSYKQACLRGDVRLDKPHTYTTKDRIIINFPTKNHWREGSSLEIIETGLVLFRDYYHVLGTVAFPKLGCGLGGLDWVKVKPIMEKQLTGLPIPIYIYT